MSYNVPTISHLYFAIMTMVMQHGVLSGRVLRNLLKEEGIPLTGPAFYQCMSRMSAAGLVHIHREDVQERDLSLKETKYSLSDEGRSQYDSTLDFYLQRADIAQGARVDATRKCYA